nr:MAG TPA: hypothetical protein [Bacteriophage sp.]
MICIGKILYLFISMFRSSFWRGLLIFYVLKNLNIKNIL